MQRKRKNKILLVLLIVLLLIVTGCKKEETNPDALKFKEEFESYNETLTKLDISEDNPFVYTNDIYNLVENEKALVIFYGNPKDEESRKMVESIINASSESGLKKVYFVKTDDNEGYSIGGHNIENIPSLVGVIRKDVSNIITNKDEVNLVIDPVVQELNTCDIDQGC